MTLWCGTLWIISLWLTYTQTVFGWTYCSSRTNRRHHQNTKLCSSFDDDNMEDMMNPFSSLDPNEMFPSPFDDNNKVDDDNDNIVDNPGSLQQMLRSADNTVWGSTKSNRRVDAETVAKLQEIAQKELMMQQKQEQQNMDRDPDDEISKLEYREIMGTVDDEDDENEMAHFLSEDDYMQASRAINPDGSLPNYMFDPNSKERPEIEEKEGEEEDLTMNDLMDAIKQQQAMPRDDKQAKAMRDQVFANEPDFSSEYVESDEYKQYEEVLGQGIKQGKFTVEEEDELDLALDELQQMIDAKEWEPSASISEEDSSSAETQNEES